MYTGAYIQYYVSMIVQDKNKKRELLIFELIGRGLTSMYETSIEWIVEYYFHRSIRRVVRYQL